MKHKRTKKDKILWELWMLKIKYRLYVSDFLNKIKYKIYCKRGYHKITDNYISTENSKGEKKEVHYIECKICKTKYFVSVEDKNKYIQINESWNDIMTYHLKQIIEDGKKNKTNRLHSEDKELKMQ